MSKTRILIVLTILCVCLRFRHAVDVTAASRTTIGYFALRSPDNCTGGLPARVLVGTMPVRHRAIVFCDANAARCRGLAIFGTAQLTRTIPMREPCSGFLMAEGKRGSELSG
jgi:hypothetical protein